MAQNRYTLVLAAALVTAAAATFGVYRVIESTKAQNQVVLRSIVLASTDVPEGAALTKESLTTSQWPSAAVPPGAFGSIDSVAGRVSRVAIFKGEAIVPGRLAPVGTGTGLQIKITPGKRAMAVRIDDVAGVSGLIQPDSRVDVIVTLRDAQSENTQVSKIFMSNMRVLSVGTVDRSGPDNRPIQATTATLEVTPFEAERLAVAMRDGTIQLALRGYGDPDSITTKGAYSDDMLTRAPRAVVRAPAPASPRRAAPTPVASTPAPTPVAVPKAPDSLAVQVFRGDKLTQQKFQKTDSVGRKPPPFL